MVIQIIINFVLHCRQPASVKKLPVTLYYEALCPYCMKFVTSQLNPSLIHKNRLAVTELTLVPYGNAVVGVKFFCFDLF